MSDLMCKRNPPNTASQADGAAQRFAYMKPKTREEINSTKPNKPYSIHDGQGVRVQRFASYGEAEKAAAAWCREKQAPVDVRRRRTHLATALPQAGRAQLVEMTWAGSAYA